MLRRISAVGIWCALMVTSGQIGIPQVLAHGTQANSGEYSAPAVKSAEFWEFLSTAAQAAARVRIDTSDGYRYIEADALPDHPTGHFPNHRNPHSIEPQKLSYRVPLTPQKAAWQESLGHQPFGVALNGVPFDPLTAEFWNNDRRAGWNIEALSGKVNLGLDGHNAHVQPDGTYHYHGLPDGLLASKPFKDKPVLLGYAADGYPIYAPWGYSNPKDPKSPMIKLRPSHRIKSGARPDGPGGAYDGTFVQDYEYADGLGDLDKCNGRDGVTPEYPQGTYHYIITTTYPFIPRCFTGNPDSSFDRHPAMSGGGPPGANRPGPPRQRQMGATAPRGGPPDLNKAARSLGVSAADLRRALGPPPPNFDAAARKLGISRTKLIDALHPDGGGPPR